MGRRGPAPTPTAVLKRRGSWRAKLNKNEPQSKPGIPECPEWLSDEAYSVWEQLTPQLEEMGVLTQIDRNALARYCVTWTHWRQCIETIEEHGRTYPVTNKAGDMVGYKPVPEAKIVIQLGDQLNRLEQKFGLTPSDRTRIEVKPPDSGTSNGKARFFSQN